MHAHTLSALLLASAALAAPVAPSNPSSASSSASLQPLTTDAPSLAGRSAAVDVGEGDLAWTLTHLALASAFSVKMGASRLATAERPWQTWRASVLSAVRAGELTLGSTKRKVVAAKTSSKKKSTKKTSTKKSTKKSKTTKTVKTTKTTKAPKSTIKTTKTAKKTTSSHRAATSLKAGANQLAQSPIGVVPVATTAAPVTTSDATTTAKRTTTTTKKRTTTTKKAATATTKYVTSTGSYWAQPTQYDNLAEWEAGFTGGSKYPWGYSNLAVVQGPPQAYYNVTLAAEQGITACNNTLLAEIDANSEVPYVEGQQCPGNSSLTEAATIVDDTESAIQVKYPKGSYSPSNKPIGGIGGYSSRLAVASAQNVTLEYSVFFPAGFDFVKGGKLPGLYGGSKACSGGSAAETCFSTRLMFRSGAAGELYMYAPREKQVESLCTLKPGLSFCNSVYGMSIGRGSWTFKTGVWTHIRQDIWLNTPGVADGGFNIFINGDLVLSNSETYYRNSLAGKTVAGNATAAPITLIDYDALPADTDIPQGGFEYLEEVAAVVDGPVDPLTDATGDSLGLRRRGRTSVDLSKRATVASIPGFLGIMFDTFFGGSDTSYATKRDQYSYFKRFSLRINDYVAPGTQA